MGRNRVVAISAVIVLGSGVTALLFVLLGRPEGLLEAWFDHPWVVLIIWCFAVAFVAESWEGITSINRAEALEAARAADEAARDPGAFADYLSHHFSARLDAARDTAELAHWRATALWRMAVGLTVVSVIAPIAATILFVTGSQAESAPWQILLVGVSAGFMFLAGAQAAVAQHSRQVGRQEQAEDRVTSYQNAVIAYKISLRDESPIESGEVVEALVRQMVGLPGRPSAPPAEDGDGTHLVETAKKVVSLAKDVTNTT